MMGQQQQQMVAEQAGGALRRIVLVVAVVLSTVTVVATPAIAQVETGGCELQEDKPKGHCTLSGSSESLDCIFPRVGDGEILQGTCKPSSALSLLVANLSKERASLTDVSLPLLTGQAGHHPTQTPILTLAT